MNKTVTIMVSGPGINIEHVVDTTDVPQLVFYRKILNEYLKNLVAAAKVEQKQEVAS